MAERPSLVAGVLRRYFGAATHPVNLAIARLLVFGILLQLVLDQGIQRYADTPAILRVPPDGWQTLITWMSFDASTMLAAKIAAAVFCALALLGWRTRPMAALATLCCVYVLTIPEVFGKVDHKHQHLFWFAALLAAAPSGDALSLDRCASAASLPPARPCATHCRCV